MAVLIFFSRDRNPYALYPRDDDRENGDWDAEWDEVPTDVRRTVPPSTPAAPQRPPTPGSERGHADDWPAELP
jgi:hypothetical protein